MDFHERWNDTCSTVSGSVRIGDLRLLRKLIREGRPIDVMDNRGWRPIHEAAILSDANPQLIIEELLKHEDSDSNWRTHEGETAMQLSCKHNTNEDAAYKAVEILLRYKADPNIADNEEETPLLAASRAGFTKVVKLLSSHDCVDVNKSDLGLWTPLHEAATRGDVTMLRTLLSACAKLNKKDECGMTPLFTAAQHGRYQCLEILIEEIISQDVRYLIDEGANDGATPLMISAQMGFTDCIKLMISAGADPNKTANDGVSALHLAAECGHHETVEVLLNHMNVQQISNELMPHLNSLKIRNPLHLAITCERIACLEVLLKSNFPVDSVDYLFEQKFSMAVPRPKYITALGLAVSLNFVNIAKILLKYGANPNSIHPNVFTPLHCIFSVIDSEFERDSNIVMLELLLRNSAIVNYCRSDEEPNELLHAIFKPQHFKLLLMNGLDITTCFKEGYINRFLPLSLHAINHEWHNYFLPMVVKIIERNSNVRDYFTALAQHIDITYVNRYKIDGYDQTLWGPIFDMFESPHTLKEFCRFYVRKRVYTYCNYHQKNFIDVISSLDVPQCLKEYLLFKNININSVMNKN